MNTPVAIETDHPVLLFGGPYGNLQATRAVLEEARRLAIPPERIVCTGDVVAYCGDPVATVDAVRGAGIHVVMGNCEESLANGAEDCGCGFRSGSTCDRLSAAWCAHANSVIDSGRRTWMAGLPRRLDIVVGGIRLAVVHGGVHDISSFFFASTSSAAKLDELRAAGTEGIVAGHCGLPFTQTVDNLLWHNPGAIGLPANDGTPRVWFSILTPSSAGLHIAHQAVVYAHSEAADRIRRVGLPVGYADAVEIGLWPSCEVLPAAELTMRGTPLVPGDARYRPIVKRRKQGVVSEPMVQNHWPRLGSSGSQGRSRSHRRDGP